MKFDWFYNEVFEHKDYFDNYSFKLTKKSIKKDSCEIVFSREDLYIKFYASNHPKDYPPFFNIILGKGSTEFPESDWNSVALWRLKKHLNPQRESKEYELDRSHIKEVLKSSIADLSAYAKPFLENDLNTFLEVRKLQNQDRQPYSINIPGDEGFIKVDEWTSKELKKKYSK